MTGAACIIAARRSIVAPHGGALRDFQPEELAAPLINALLADAEISGDEVDEVILSNALGAGGNPARRAALAAGLPERIAGLSIDRQCVGGLDAILLGDALIRAGVAEVVLAGGAESSSLRPDRYYRAHWGAEPEFRHQAPFTPWAERDPTMLQAAADLAERLGITREEQDRWAIASHHRARTAPLDTASEIKNPEGVEARLDPFTRELTPRLCARAKVVTGTITSANTSVDADGAAMVLLIGRERYAAMERRLRQRPFAMRVLSGSTLGGDPTCPGLAPVGAIRQALKDADLVAADLACIELMEAFAAQAIACQRGAALELARINLGGGSLARGHPIGASGAILAVRLFHLLRGESEGALGMAAIAAAGGLGTAAIFSRV
ncbi:MAG: thiolase family protein [Neomegalonema sp.]|nr:thiolase family protein [Neomegalonema sp.]